MLMPSGPSACPILGDGLAIPAKALMAAMALQQTGAEAIQLIRWIQMQGQVMRRVEELQRSQQLFRQQQTFLFQEFSKLRQDHLQDSRRIQNQNSLEALFTRKLEDVERKQLIHPELPRLLACYESVSSSLLKLKKELSLLQIQFTSIPKQIDSQIGARFALLQQSQQLLRLQNQLQLFQRQPHKCQIQFENFQQQVFRLEQLIRRLETRQDQNEDYRLLAIKRLDEVEQRVSVLQLEADPLQYVYQVRAELKQNLDSEIKSVKQGLRNADLNINRMLDQLVSLHQTKADSQTVQSLSRDGQSRWQQNNHIQQSLKQDLKELLDQIQKSTLGYQHQLQELRVQILKITAIQAQKLSRQEFAAQIVNKLQDRHIHPLLKELASLKQDKLSQEEFSGFSTTLKGVLQQLQHESRATVLRWRSGARKGGLVIWDQFVNCFSNDVSWTQGCPIFKIKSGIYQVQFGFFSKSKPSVQLLLNNHPVLMAVNSASYVVHHSSGRLKDVRHPLGAVTGLTLNDFVRVESQCELSVSVSEQCQSGFLSLRRV